MDFQDVEDASFLWSFCTSYVNAWSLDGLIIAEMY